ncbi:MAG TPA: (Fe-S)-binding protein [Candidatus Acidoferrales bacterium]|nr:(Fe-S)-binding protein [Candidatus Acidoferrales bacterium]
MKHFVPLREMERPDASRPLVELGVRDLAPLPEPLASDAKREWKALSDSVKQGCECGLDNTCALNLPKPKDRNEEEALVQKFVSGLNKLFEPENNWTFLQPLLLTMESCVGCQTCAESCHVFQSSGRAEVYRPTFRTELLRRAYFKYVKQSGALSRFQHGNIQLNWPLIARLAELSYRCNLCRRCAQSCPMGADNALATHELRKLFSQEMGIAPKELHERGSMVQLKAGSSTGMTPRTVRDNIQFIDEDISDRTGIKVETPWDVEGADILLIHNAGEILAWPENPGAFAAILNAAGIKWTLSSELVGYDSVNYGLWYDDVQFARMAIRHAEVARKLKAKAIVIGECGHAHKALAVVADRLLHDELNIPRVSSMTLLRDIVMSGRLDLDPTRNDFPITLHDPCNLVRLMGVVEPQREILRRIAPQFREMTPHGVDNYCCGGGSGFAIMSRNNFADWRANVSGRKKVEQIINAFAECLHPDEPKYVCAPCSNCKGQIRDLLAYYNLWKQYRIGYGGLAELIVNAMRDVKPGFIDWEWH